MEQGEDVSDVDGKIQAVEDPPVLYYQINMWFQLKTFLTSTLLLIALCFGANAKQARHETWLTTVDIADLFPFHTVDNGSLENIRSHILGGQIRISYYKNNFLSEVEILAPDARISEMKLNELFIGDLNIFGKTLDDIKKALLVKNFQFLATDEGFDLVDGSVAFYSHEFEDDLNVLLDAVVLRFA